MKKFAKLFVATLLACSVLVGCGKSYSSLEEYFNDHADEIAEAEEAGECKCEVSGNTLTYIYTYDETYSEDDIAIMAEAIEGGLKDNEEALIDARDAIRKESGIEDATTEYVYKDAAGTVIYSCEY